MPSFDIVSEIDKVEVKNAADNAARELSTRFDFRGVDAAIEFANDAVSLKAEGDFQLQQLQDILRNACAKRNVDARAIKAGDVERTGKTHKQQITFLQGIDHELGKKINKLIKDKKLKVQSSIQGEQVRVTGKKRDDLQNVIAMLKGEDFGQPLQFKNFRD